MPIMKTITKTAFIPMIMNNNSISGGSVAEELVVVVLEVVLFVTDTTLTNTSRTPPYSMALNIDIYCRGIYCTS
jgi:hypothetical protein